MNARILLAAGGTGGHLFPAEALAHVLTERGCEILLATDTRAEKFGAHFPARKIYALPSASPRGGGVIEKGKAIATLSYGAVRAALLERRLHLDAVIGFGGYPSAPPLFAAALLGIPTILHEQNAVMGRANLFLAGRVIRIATGFPLVRASETIRAKAVVTGNPLRPAVLEAATIPFPNVTDGRLRLLVTGGSQGAKVMSDIVPAALALLAPEERARIALSQQARGEDRTRVEEAYHRLGFAAVIEPFFPDLPARIAQSHLVIARSGASTVAEIAGIGRPSLLVPFPFALDADQAANAAEMAKTGAAIVVDQKNFTPGFLAKALRHALDNPDMLQQRAAAARSVGVLNAADRLADLVLATARQLY